MLDVKRTNAYLGKLGFASASDPSKDFLDELIYAHQLSIPFSTVDIHRASASPDLSTDVIYEKVVDRGRGGYCFELNKLFEELLISLGFDARPALCRAVRGRESRMPINHRGTIVAIDGKEYLADVGFGGPMPAGSLELRDGLSQKVQGEEFITVLGEDGWWKIDRITQAKNDMYDDERPSVRQTELEVLDAEVEDIDFEALSLFCSQPGTLFRDSEVVNLRTKSGYKGYKDGIVTIRANGEKEIFAPEDDNGRDAALRDHFGIA